MNTLNWRRPETADEAVAALHNDGAKAHGGGTFLLRSGYLQVAELIDLSLLDLTYIRTQDGTHSIGATATLAMIASADTQAVVATAAARAATTPLRNRITAGGSIASAPPWSDILGPLLALDAKVSLYTPAKETVLLADYLSSRAYRNALITSVEYDSEPWSFSYHRETRTETDYPAFTVTVLGQADGGVVADSRVVIWGCKGRWSRLSAVEQEINGTKIPVIPDQLLIEMPGFADRPHGSGDYLGTCAKVAVVRGIAEVFGE